MPFDRLPDRLGSLPEFRPHIAPAPPVYDTTGAVEKGLKQVEKIVEYMSPFERQKRMIAGVQIRMQKKMLEDYQKNPNKYKILANGSIVPIGMDASKMAYQAEIMALNLLGKKQQIEINRRKINGAQPAEGSPEWKRQQALAFLNNETKLPESSKSTVEEVPAISTLNYGGATVDLDDPFGQLIPPDEEDEEDEEEDEE